ncbi:MAG: aminoacyl-histidine dipeptidase [Firmicutes bacterium HGW-Firmicutes-1]|jgi:dipeptidase D|nr:MAG: aminoacyl-histidine dipeptidase [Firmicutes bacterium HGW-Firmicutes-1]
MEYTLESLQKDKVFYFFTQISNIPRESGNEKEVSDYLKHFAEERNLFIEQDKYLNIIIKKPATPGYENAPVVILQGHMDMVCEKNEGTIHDFCKDPLRLIVDGDDLFADGTTLGADNGIAVAYALALLDADDIPHPALEILITTDEEVGLTGALEMDTSGLKGQYFINLDTEEEGEVIVSCAGGLRALIELPLEFVELDDVEYNIVQITIKGLKGGHSGMEIHKNRANAIVLLGIVLSQLNEAIDLNLCHLFGGLKDNVIPREGFVTLNVRKDQMELFHETMSKIICDLKNEYKGSDPEIVFMIDLLEEKEEEKVSQAINNKTLENIIFLLRALPNGVQSMSTEIEGLVESSINLGRLYIDSNKLCFEFASRSSVRSKKYRMVQLLKLFAKNVGATCTASKDYPEWPIKSNSKFLEICVNTYEKMHGSKPLIKGIHAGLEAGVFLEKMPHLEAISIGPNTYDVHSPDERISISSTQRTWQYLLEILKAIK